MYIYINSQQSCLVFLFILEYVVGHVFLQIEHHLQLDRLGLGPSRGVFGVPGGERGEGSAVNLGPGRLLAVKTREIHGNFSHGESNVESNSGGRAPAMELIGG